MNNLKRCTRIKEEWLNNNEISSDDLIVYVMIVRDLIGADSNNQYSVCKINDITTRLVNTKLNKNNRRWNTIVSDSIKNLILNDIIIGVCDVLNNNINTDKLDAYETFYFKTQAIDDNYINVYYDDLDLALSISKGSKISKFNFLLYCINVRSCIDKDLNLGYLPEKAFTSMMDTVTFGKYNDLIKDKIFLVECGYCETKTKMPIVLYGGLKDTVAFNNEIEYMVNTNKIHKQTTNKMVNQSVVDNSAIEKVKNDTCVYIMKDSSNAVLYVGITNNHNNRISQHYSDKKWISDVHEILISDYINRNQARIFEIYYISKLNPKYNTEFNKIDASNFELDLQELNFCEFKPNPTERSPQ